MEIYIFFSYGSNDAAKMHLYLNLPVYSLYVKIQAPRTHVQHQEMMMNKILMKTRGGPNTMSFLNHLHFQKICNMKDCLLNKKMQLQISNPLNVLNCSLYYDRSFINSDKSFINKPTFLNFVPQLLKKICLRNSTATYFLNDKTAF